MLWVGTPVVLPHFRDLKQMSTRRGTYVFSELRASHSCVGSTSRKNFGS